MRRYLVMFKHDIAKIMSCLISNHLGLILKYAVACIYYLTCDVA